MQTAFKSLTHPKAERVQEKQEMRAKLVEAQVAQRRNSPSVREFPPLLSPDPIELLDQIIETLALVAKQLASSK